MNEVTPTELEAILTFGCVHMRFCIWIYNLKISFLMEDIVLAFIDISSCFRWPRIHPDLVDVFGFMIGPLFYAVNVIVFGSIASATSWELFCRAILALVLSYFGSHRLLERHKAYLDMVRWSEPPKASVAFVPTQQCPKNKGIIRDHGTVEPSQHNMCVDDKLMANIKRRLARALVATIQAIFTIMGVPNVLLRPCAAGMDNWVNLNVNAMKILLGLLWNTRNMPVGITLQYRLETVYLLHIVWHEGRESFTIGELELLVGKIGTISQGFHPIFHLIPVLYASSAFPLRENNIFLYRPAVVIESW